MSNDVSECDVKAEEEETEKRERTKDCGLNSAQTPRDHNQMSDRNWFLLSSTSLNTRTSKMAEEEPLLDQGHLPDVPGKVSLPYRFSNH